MRPAPLLFGTNWKMHKTIEGATDYAERLRRRVGDFDSRVQIFVIPPYTAIETVRRVARGAFWVGAQNMHWAEWGPYTGEISAPMLKEIGVDLVEIGHAERRQYFNETDPSINRKVRSALRFGFRPLICVGEDVEDKKYGVERETVIRQLRIALHEIQIDLTQQLILAYEPSWAIGDAGTIADPDYVARMIAVCREVLTSLFGRESATGIPILYGGSVFEKDAPALLLGSGANGLFVGRAALDPDAFADVVAGCLRDAPPQPARSVESSS
jgi:L-erythrulose 1-phosphate isomerase